MTTYRLGSRGDEVRAIQRKLAALGAYRGPVDGDYGGGTHAAVLAFQRGRGLVADGQVGPDTWRALFAEEIPAPGVLSQDLLHRCLALTGAFETGKSPPECFCGLGGDFDGQGISFGVLQWNFGQGTLQALLGDLIEQHPQLVRDVFGAHHDAFAAALASAPDELMQFARSIQHPVTHRVHEPWRGFARTLGRTPEFQAIQAAHARSIFERALAMCADYGLWSERGAALLFDILVQNGSISKVTRARIHGEIAALAFDASEEAREVRRMEIIAHRRAEAANPRWVDDVRTRKLCIAQGVGTVHGIRYRLDEQFGIGLRRSAP